LKGKTPGIPRLIFALCLPLRIGYVVDFRTFTFVLIEFHPAHPARIPALEFRLFLTLRNGYVVDPKTVTGFGLQLKRRKWDKLLLQFAPSVELTHGF
jgi:hypothetical protein